MGKMYGIILFTSFIYMFLFILPVAVSLKNSFKEEDSKISIIQSAPQNSFKKMANNNVAVHHTMSNNNNVGSSNINKNNNDNTDQKHHLHGNEQVKINNKNNKNNYNNNNKKVKKQSLTNHEILRSLGLAKLNVPSSHHRKRLAVESRHHSRPDDSQMYIIKLPPNPVYYTKTNDGSQYKKNSIADKNKKFTVDFASNGKPGKIYHWNLPVLKLMLNKEESNGRRNANLRKSNDISELIDISHIPTWSKPWENETIEKPHRKNDKHKQHTNDSDANKTTNDINEMYNMKKSPAFYAPRPKKSSNVNKHFPGNGKPKSFYVIQKKSHKPYYQKLIY